MNKRGSIVMGLVVSVLIFVMGVLFLPALSSEIDTFRSTMTCDSATISGGNMLSCIVGDAMMPYFILLIFSIVSGILMGVRR